MNHAVPLRPLLKRNSDYRMKRLLLTFGLVLAFQAPVYAQDDVAAIEPASGEKVIEKDKTLEEQVPAVAVNGRKNFFTLGYENDLIGAGTDSDFTNGVRLSYFDINQDLPWLAMKIADIIPTFRVNQTTSVFYSVGQNMYTPKEISQRTQDPNDRPWAAFLYGSMGMATLNDNRIDELEATIGVVGPYALGEQTQKAVHKHITNSPTPKGWSNQLENEPALMVSWRRRYPYWAKYETHGYMMSASPSIGASLGNVYTHANAGMTFSLRPSKSAWEDTPLRVRPAMPGTGFFSTPEDGWGWALFAGVDGRVVGRNIFLDGNTFTDSHSVDKKPFVLDGNVGVSFTFENTRLSYTLTHRTKEFDGQEKGHVFGALSLTYKF